MRPALPCAPPPIRGAGVVTLAPRGRSSADISVHLSAADDRRAYDALEHGTALADLLTSEPHKERHDEAALVRDRTAPVAEDAPSAEDPAPDASAPAAAAPPPLDLLLQRAVQLHRALRALKRL